MKRYGTALFEIVLGAALLLIGKFEWFGSSSAMVQGLCFGAGAALLALGAGNLARHLIVPKLEDDEMRKRTKIEMKDERNIRIREKSGNMTARIMNYVLAAFVLTLGFMKVDMVILYLAVSLIVIELAILILSSVYYSKRM